MLQPPISTRVFTLAYMLFCCLPMQGQISSRNSYWLPNKDTLRVLLVFAEAVGDPLDNYRITTGDVWQRGQIPRNADSYFDPHFQAADAMQGYMTRYFHQASFGQYVLLGDYYPEMISVDYGELKGFGDEQVLEALQERLEGDLRTAHGLSVRAGDFDLWTAPDGYGMPKIKAPDGYIDFIMIMWRVNSKVTKKDNAGSVNVRKWKRPFIGSEGFMDRSRFVSNHSNAYVIIRHEFAHSLFGPNNFHTAGSGAGESTFLSAVGGYAALSSFGAFSDTWNGYDRYRMGWEPPDAKHLIAAPCGQDKQPVHSDLTYGQALPCEEGEFILRDFITYGDAIRIELPYLRSQRPEVHRQWLWLENHRLKDGNIDHHGNSAPGVYAYIQVNKEDTTDFRANTHYTYPIHPYGHYDFGIDVEEKRIFLRSDRENPFTGYHFLLMGAYDLVNPNYIIRRGDTLAVFEDMILKSELFYPEKVSVDGFELAEDNFNFKSHPMLGSRFDAFQEGDKISLGTNPASTPVLTYKRRSRDNQGPYPEPQAYDNRHIHLSGLSVHFVEELDDGALKVRIRWDDYLVDEDARWCGDIIVHEKIHLASRKRILIDHGLTPVRPNNPVLFRGIKIFADPSSLYMKENSSLKLDVRSSLELRNASTLTAAEGTSLHLCEKSALVIEEDARVLLDSSRLQLDKKATIRIKAGGSLEMEKGGLIMGEKASITVDEGGRLSLGEGVQIEQGLKAGIYVAEGAEYENRAGDDGDSD